jgi:predicted aldo/keto reductase-like oxidoreductase
MKKELKNKIAVLEKTFEWKKDEEKKDNGFYIITSETPQELKDIFFKNEFEVEDYNYNWFSEAFDIMLEAVEEAKDIDEAVSIIDNLEFEIEADIYTSNLTEWLNSSNYRVDYLGRAVKEMGAGEGIEILSWAQYLEKQEIFDNARRSFIDYLQLSE